MTHGHAKVVDSGANRSDEGQTLVDQYPFTPFEVAIAEWVKIGLLRCFNSSGTTLSTCIALSRGHETPRTTARHGQYHEQRWNQFSHYHPYQFRLKLHTTLKAFRKWSKLLYGIKGKSIWSKVTYRFHSPHFLLDVPEFVFLFKTALGQSPALSGHESQRGALLLHIVW